MCARYYVVAMGYMVGVVATASMDGKAANVMWLKPNVFIKAVMVMVDAGKGFAFVLLVGQGKAAKQEIAMTKNALAMAVVKMHNVSAISVG
jgi:hypothetical protein